MQPAASQNKAKFPTTKKMRNSVGPNFQNENPKLTKEHASPNTMNPTTSEKPTSSQSQSPDACTLTRQTAHKCNTAKAIHHVVDIKSVPADAPRRPAKRPIE